MKQGSIAKLSGYHNMLVYGSSIHFTERTSEPDFYIELCVLIKYIAMFMLVHARDKDA